MGGGGDFGRVFSPLLGYSVGLDDMVVIDRFQFLEEPLHGRCLRAPTGGCLFGGGPQGGGSRGGGGRPGRPDGGGRRCSA
jgi:hypothetical protein